MRRAGGKRLAGPDFGPGKFLFFPAPQAFSSCGFLFAALANPARGRCVGGLEADHACVVLTTMPGEAPTAAVTSRVIQLWLEWFLSGSVIACE